MSRTDSWRWSVWQGCYHFVTIFSSTNQYRSCPINCRQNRKHPINIHWGWSDLFQTETTCSVLLLADASKTLLCTLKDTQFNKSRVCIVCVTSLQHQMWSKLPRLSPIATSFKTSICALQTAGNTPWSRHFHLYYITKAKMRSLYELGMRRSKIPPRSREQGEWLVCCCVPETAWSDFNR